MKRIILASVLIAAIAPALAIIPANTQGPAQGPEQGATRKSAASPAPKASLSPQGYAATQVVKPPAVMPPPVNADQSRKHADDSSSMRRGVVQKADVAKGKFQVYGQAITFDPKSVRVIGANGKPTSIYALKNGASVRFTLDPADPTSKRAAVIYVN